jgi:mRNA-degrading endonuclease toxin of MazEF toxin-antitoxin module
MRTKRQPNRGEIWWTNFPTDPPDKGRRPVIIVSPNVRNHHERASTVLVVPLSTSVHRIGPAHVLLRAGETGLGQDCVAQADSVTVVLKDKLSEPRTSQRSLTNHKICVLADMVRLAMECASHAQEGRS